MTDQLRISITQIDAVAHPGKILVELPDYEVKATSILAFAGEMELAAILKALNADGGECDPSLYTEPEQQWLYTQKLVIQSEGRDCYSARLTQWVGQELFASLFPNSELRGIYDQVRRASGGGGVHLEIRFDTADVLVGTQAWELLHDGTDFVCGGGRGTLTRYLTFDMPPVSSPPPEVLRALVISARPAGLEPIPTDDFGAVQDGAKQGDQLCIQAETLEPPTLHALEAYLSSSGVPQIIHFDGHGAFGRKCPRVSCGMVTESKRARKCAYCGQPFRDDEFQGYLAFEDAEKKTDWVTTKRIADLIRECQPEDSTQPGLVLVVLSACRTGVARNAESVFNGVAQRLIDARVPAVVATQFNIEAHAAAEFVKWLYAGIAQGQPLRKAVSRWPHHAWPRGRPVVSPGTLSPLAGQRGWTAVHGSCEREAAAKAGTSTSTIT